MNISPSMKKRVCAACKEVLSSNEVEHLLRYNSVEVNAAISEIRPVIAMLGTNCPLNKAVAKDLLTTVIAEEVLKSSGKCGKEPTARRFREKDYVLNPRRKRVQ